MDLTILEGHVKGPTASKRSDHYYGNSKSDVAVRNPNLLHIDSSNSFSGSDVSFQRYITSFDIAAHGLVTRFGRSSPIRCSLESLTLPNVEDAEYILVGVTRAHAILSSPTSRTFG